MVFQNNVLSGAAGSDTTVYEIEQSIRFNDNDSSYMYKAFSGAGNKKTATMSCWVKLGSNLSNRRGIFSFIGDVPLEIFTGDTLRVFTFGTTSLVTNRVFRDPSAWYHFVVSIDSTQSVSTDRIRLYVNGQRETSFSTESYPSLNADGTWWGSNFIQIGRTYGTSVYMDGYLAEIVYIDGTSLDPSSFGEYNSSGIWIPKDVSGLTFGTNGFYLKGADSSALGTDSSGNGSNFTTSGLAADDKKIDSPTNNHATWSPITGSAQVYSNGNLNAATASSAWKGGFTTIQVPLNSGTWYYEMYIDSAGSSSGQLSIGWSESDRSVTDNNDSGDTQGWVTYALNGKTYNNAASTVSYGATYTTGDVIGCKIDTDTSSNNITFYKNGASQGNLSEAFNGGTTGFISPYILLYGTRNATARFAQAEWTQTPSGITEDNAINTKNLGS
tara:strand:- start:24 stop:1346 length:1323 start_codon:yes stop_codon:yes gene_type:complete